LYQNTSQPSPQFDVRNTTQPILNHVGSSRNQESEFSLKYDSSNINPIQNMDGPADISSRSQNIDPMRLERSTIRKIKGEGMMYEHKRRIATINQKTSLDFLKRVNVRSDESSQIKLSTQYD
jgi:hypothetical protein